MRGHVINAQAALHKHGEDAPGVDGGYARALTKADGAWGLGLGAHLRAVR